MFYLAIQSHRPLVPGGNETLSSFAAKGA